MIMPLNAHQSFLFGVYLVISYMVVFGIGSSSGLHEKGQGHFIAPLPVLGFLPCYWHKVPPCDFMLLACLFGCILDMFGVS
jgi:hypothetical protein